MSQTQKIVELLSDGNFHSNLELHNTVGWRFGARLFDLKQKGYVFEKERRNNGDRTYIEYWKMIETPKVIDCYSMFEPMRFEKETFGQSVFRFIRNIF